MTTTLHDTPAPADQHDPHLLLDRYAAVRAQTESAGGAALPRGPDGPVDARRLARPSGTAPTSPGSSRPSCSPTTRPGFAPFQDTLLVPVQQLLRGGRAALRARPSAASSAGPAPHDVGALPRQRRRPDARPARPARRRHARQARRRPIELGFHHEQQHQELLLMDIKHVLSPQPAAPGLRRHAQRDHRARPAGLGRPRGRPGRDRPPGRRASASTTSCPRHRVGSSPTASPTASSPTASGWSSWPTAATAGTSSGSPTAGRRVNAEGWRAPFYWTEVDGAWFEHTLTAPGRSTPACR